MLSSSSSNAPINPLSAPARLLPARFQRRSPTPCAVHAGTSENGPIAICLKNGIKSARHSIWHKKNRPPKGGRVVNLTMHQTTDDRGETRVVLFQFSLVPLKLHPVVRQLAAVMLNLAAAGAVAQILSKLTPVLAQFTAIAAKF